MANEIEVPLINGKAHAWGDVSLTLFGAQIKGITAISYKDSQEKTNEYGAGHYPVSRSYGKYAAEAEITIELKEMHAIQAAARAKGFNRIQDIAAFNIEVAYQSQPGIIVNDRINNVEFTDNVRETTQDGGRVLVKCMLVTSHITWDSQNQPGL